MIYKFIILTLTAGLSLMLACCECVPGLDTEKKKTPDESAYVLFINAIPEVPVVNMEADIVNLLDIEYDRQVFGYDRIGAGTNSIRYINSENNISLFNIIIDLEKDEDYSFFGYEKGSRAKGLILSDAIEPKLDTRSYLRIINLASGSPDLKVTVTGLNQDIILPFERYTDFLEFFPGDYNINIYNNQNDSLLTSGSVKLTETSTATYLIRGIYGSSSPTKALNTKMIKAGT